MAHSGKYGMQIWVPGLRARGLWIGFVPKNEPEAAAGRVPDVIPCIFTVWPPNYVFTDGLGFFIVEYRNG